jgi:DNA-binding response OmpR family regulator
VKQRILIVEDDPSITRMVRDNLVYEGFDVECVTRGDLALSHVRSFAPDLILLDLMLPGLDGFEVCRAVAQSALHVPMIIVSARSRNTDKIQGLELGADDYITKPFMFGEL